MTDAALVVLVAVQHFHAIVELLDSCLKWRRFLNNEEFGALAVCPVEILHHELHAVLILFHQHTNSKQHIASIVIDSAEQYQIFGKSCSLEPAVNEYKVSIVSVVFNHVVAGKEQVVEDAWLLDLLLHVQVAELLLFHLSCLDTSKASHEVCVFCEMPVVGVSWYFWPTSV